MAASTVQTKALSSENFVESCGAILFDLSNLSDIKVCLIQHRDCGEWHFAKGRRNQNEARKDAAIREVMEETGFRCRLLPVTMPTRATAEDAHADVHDKPQVCENLTEPFMCHIRNLKHGKGTKIIWWFIAVLEDDKDKAKLPGEYKWLPVLLPWRRALNTLTFQNDRELLHKALQLLQSTFPTLVLSSTSDADAENIPLADNTGNLNAKAKQAYQRPLTKKAMKRAAKTVKALQRQRTQEGQSKSTTINVEPMEGFNSSNATASRRTQQQEDKRLRNMAKRQKRREKKAAEGGPNDEKHAQQDNQSPEQGAVQETGQHTPTEHALDELDANDASLQRGEDQRPDYSIANNDLSASWIGNELYSNLDNIRNTESNASPVSEDPTERRKSARLLAKPTRY